jgi:hypothetical protein
MTVRLKNSADNMRAKSMAVKVIPLVNGATPGVRVLSTGTVSPGRLGLSISLSPVALVSLD